MIAVAFAWAGGPAVHEVRWARPFTLAEPWLYDHTAAPRPVREGWLVELRVDPAAMRPLQVGVPLLWIGGDVAVRLNWDAVGGCAVAWVPGAHELRAEPIFFGSSELPERVDEAVRTADLTRRDRSTPAPALGDVQGSPLAFARYADLLAAAADRIDACSPGERSRAEVLRATAR